MIFKGNFSGLECETTYYLVANATDTSANISEDSTEASFTTTDCGNPPLPFIPVITQTIAGVGEIFIEWNPISEADLYYACWSTASSFPGPATECTDVPASETHFFIENLESDEYFMEVFSYGFYGLSDPSEIVSAITALNNPPLQARNLVADAGNRKINMEWDPANGASHYLITWYRGETAVDADWTTTPDYPIEGLVNHVTYTVKILSWHYVNGFSLLDSSITAMPHGHKPPPDIYPERIRIADF